MPAPIDYSTSVQSPFQALAQGYTLGAAIRNDQQQQQQLALAQQQQQQQSRVIQSLVSNPNAGAADYSNAMLLVPGLKDQLTNAWKTKSDAQQQSALSDMSQWTAAIQQGQPQVASAAMRARADAMEQANGGQPTPSSQALRTQADVVDAHPDFAAFQLKATLAAHGDAGSKIVDQIASIQKQPTELLKSQADASSAATKATKDAATLPAEIAKPALENQKTQQDIAASQLAGRISELNTQIAQENSQTERGKLVLERDKLTQEQLRQQQTQGRAVQDSQDSSLAALQTIQEIKNHPGMKDNWLQMIPGNPGSKPGDLWGAFYAKLPGTDRNALEGYVDTLKSQLGFANLMTAKNSSPTGASGFGALSEGELKLISDLAGNLNTNSKDFPQQLEKVETAVQKALAKGVANPALPTAGGAFVVSSPKYGVIDEGRVNALLKQFPGSTRAQVLQFLQQQPAAPQIPN